MSKTKWYAKPIYVMVALALLLLPIPVAANGVTVSIDAPDEVAYCTNFIARVNVSEVTNFDSCQLYISYDPAVIEVADVTAGLIDSTSVPIEEWAFVPPAVQGAIMVKGNVTGTVGVNGTGYLAEIHFHVIGSPCNNSEITLSNAALFDNEGQLIVPLTLESDSVHVATPPVPSVPTVGHWGIVAMISLFAGFLVWTVRRRLPAA